MVEKKLIMGTNTWERDMPKEPLIFQALKFADDVKSQGIATLVEAWIDHDAKLMWCTWETENFEGLQAAFNKMNKQSGLKSELSSIEKMYPK